MNDVLVAVLVLLHQTIIAVNQGAVLLLDEQHVAVAVDDDEIHLAEVGPLGILAEQWTPWKTVKSSERRFFRSASVANSGCGAPARASLDTSDGKTRATRITQPANIDERTAKGCAS